MVTMGWFWSCSKKDHIVTNCHVIADAQGINVNKYGIVILHMQ